MSVPVVLGSAAPPFPVPQVVFGLRVRPEARGQVAAVPFSRGWRRFSLQRLCARGSSRLSCRRRDVCESLPPFSCGSALFRSGGLLARRFAFLAHLPLLDCRFGSEL